MKIQSGKRNGLLHGEINKTIWLIGDKSYERKERLRNDGRKGNQKRTANTLLWIERADGW